MSSSMFHYLSTDFRKFRPLLLICAGAVFALSSTGWFVHAANELARSEKRLESLRQTLHTINARPPTDQAVVTSFISGLPTEASIDPTLSHLQHVSAEHSVGFVSVAVSDRTASIQTVGRTRLQVILRGSYPNLKDVLAETFDRFPGMLLEHLSLRRMVNPTDLEARVDLLLITRPLAAAAVAR